jgi:hypothetical protein
MAFEVTEHNIAALEPLDNIHNTCLIRYTGVDGLG